jgi:hypothetical protein
MRRDCKINVDKPEPLNKSDAIDLRPEGPAFNSHAREGVDQELPKGERRRCGTKIDAGMMCRPVGPQNLSITSTPSRAWLLDTGPSGLRSS